MRQFLCSIIILTCLYFGIVQHSTAQDSSRLRISLLTCTPGNELYAIFGHSALRVIDSNSVTDYVYNYGTFNFNDEGFYIKFTRGKLMYYISIERFDDFQYSYQSWGREMTEQLLNLTAEEKKNIQRALFENLKEENKYYKYDFFFDNCTTRLRDLILKYKKPSPQLPAVMPENTRFRQAIHQYLDKGEQYWSKLGIDILLDARTDRIMTPAEQQFLPDNLMVALDSNRNGNIILQSKKLYTLPERPSAKIWFTPMVFFCFLLGIVFAFSFSKKSFIQSFLNRLDGLLFFLTGALGIILLLMWFATDHSMTKDNYNLLWAWPFHAVMAFFINSSKPFVKKYLLATILFYGLVILAWFFLPQQLNNALLPFVLLLLFRAAIRYNRN